MIDLKDLLDDRSTTPPEVSQHLRLDQVQGRIAVRRRRRTTAAGALAALIALVVVGYTVAPGLRAAPEPAVTRIPPTVKGFPKYNFGTKVVAAERTAPGVTTLTLTWLPAPTVTTYTVIEKCWTALNGGTIEVDIKVNGGPRLGGSCGGGWTSALDEQARARAARGEPIVFTMTATGYGDYDSTAGEWRTGPLPADAVLGMAVAEPVPFADYPLPSRPERLKPLDLREVIVNEGITYAPISEAVEVHSDPADPSRPQRITLLWQDHYSLVMAAQTPGVLTFAADGSDFDTASWWSYEGGHIVRDWDTADYQPLPPIPGFVRPPAGTVVTLTVTPQHFTGAWAVRLVAGKETPGRS
ncbi:hypothetical protein ACFQY4_38535 [Catellatospora bangladeshensis]|uniref:Uncharacterized protein n=1 Tax=Catellatospora bangladeshensis TaxID=310355 RepID=A0A8J3JK56_9ACTN|nr:hypothetical protein [Catellatospora bangladeshensis]GIF84029.1 hypothetical protein Cba03nite_53780 [Catellatospora bangladeshensis]